MANPQHEPTMEEILASIRKIISDDATAAPVASTAPPPEHKPAEPEVLDLTHEVAEPAVATVIASPAIETTPEETHPAPQCETPAGPVPEAETASAPQLEEGIFSEKARQALSDAMAGIAETPAPPTEETHAETHTAAVVGIAGLSVEAVFERAVKESFDPVLQKWLTENNEALVDRVRPVIRDWLDENLPALLEDAIRSELARAKSRTRR
jgi:cell pole-organizing protein PopZ